MIGMTGRLTPFLRPSASRSEPRQLPAVQSAKRPALLAGSAVSSERLPCGGEGLPLSSLSSLCQCGVHLVKSLKSSIELQVLPFGLPGWLPGGFAEGGLLEAASR